MFAAGRLNPCPSNVNGLESGMFYGGKKKNLHSSISKRYGCLILLLTFGRVVVAAGGDFAHLEFSGVLAFENRPLKRFGMKLCVQCGSQKLKQNGRPLWM